MGYWGVTMDITEEVFPDNLVLMGYRGSKAIGTYMEGESDIDLIGTFVAPKEHYIGLGGREETIEKEIGDYDMIFYEVRKFFKLLLDSNPNVLTLLGIPDEMVLESGMIGMLIRNNLELFVSTQEVYDSFVGYARSQLGRFDGGDWKNAMHAIRLLRMGTEFLETGELNIQRDDAEELLEIRKGNTSEEWVRNEFEIWMDRAKEAYEGSVLPEQADRDAVEKLLMSIVGENVIKGLGG